MVERRTTPRRALGDLGDEPDARFSFANERTYLAWNRTALGSVVAGLAVANVLAPDDEGVGPELLGVALIGLGLVLAALSYINWFRNEQALCRTRRCCWCSRW
jgi:putative membrane protein